MQQIKIRQAQPEEEKWVNEQYQSVEFMTSDLNKDYVVIAEFSGVKVGLGRLVSIDDSSYELGGMYVLPEYRKKGIAGQIVAHLVNAHDASKTLWCIPFAHLVPFYSQYGFQVFEPEKINVPDQVIAKYRWCDGQYKNQVGFMKMDAKI